MFENIDENIVYRVSVTKEAQEDIEELTRFYIDCAGNESGIRFEAAAETMLETLAVWPRSHAKWKEDDTIRRVNLPRHKVAIIYKIEDAELEVIAVAAFHTLSDPAKAESLVKRRTNP